MMLGVLPGMANSIAGSNAFTSKSVFSSTSSGVENSFWRCSKAPNVSSTRVSLFIVSVACEFSGSEEKSSPSAESNGSGVAATPVCNIPSSYH